MAGNHCDWVYTTYKCKIKPSEVSIWEECKNCGDQNQCVSGNVVAVWAPVTLQAYLQL